MSTDQRDLFADRVPLPPSMEQARRERDLGMTRALNHAESIESDWNMRAFNWIAAYARTHHRFISEDCTAAAAVAGLVSPADPRAWGHPFRRAAKAGIIRKVGFGIATGRHLSPCPLWESCL